MKLLASVLVPYFGLEFSLGVRKVRRPAPLPSMPPRTIDTSCDLVELTSEPTRLATVHRLPTRAA